MEISFWMKLGLSFVVGSVWITASTVAAERFGSKVGGLIGGLPSTIVVTLFFIGMTQTPEIAAEAAVMVPLVMGLNGVFMVVFLSLVRRGLGISLAGAFLIWLCLASILVMLEIRELWISISGWLLLTVFCVLIVEKHMKIDSQGRRTTRYTSGQIASRAAIGGTVIAGAVLIGKLAGPLLGGILATFPAVFLSTLIITYRTGGPDFSRATAKSLMVSGLINVPIYALLVWFLYPRADLGVGTLVALLLTMGSALLTGWFIQARLA